MGDLNKAIFAVDAQSTSNTFRQNLQTSYTKKLISIINSKPKKDKNKANYSSISKAIALYNLKEIKKMMKNNIGDIQTKAHKGYLITLIDNTLENLS